MKAAIIVVLMLILAGTILAQGTAKTETADASIDAFWEKFRTAVIKRDKAAVANLSQFPISMPYGVPNVKNNPQLIRRYRSIFFFDHNAPECFTRARPEINPEKPKEFTVACKNAAGEEVIIYLFILTKKGWRFTGLDNINE